MARRPPTTPARKRRTPRALTEYGRKRRFDVTPEPAPAPVEATGDALRFMVHKHDASRLHYDLRLEIDGALASWAVPKGPTFDPGVRRLAVQTEDHPLEYAEFEGRIPDGEYGAGDSLVWDRGTWETVPPGQQRRMRREGHLEFLLHGEKLEGRWHLVRTRQDGKAQWLLFKGRDAFARAGDDIVARRPESVVSGRRITRGPVRARAWSSRHPDPMTLLLKVWPPMLATLAKKEPPGSFLHEIKYDGFRALAGISNGRISLQSRNGLDLAGRFPSIAKALSNVSIPEAVIDGEIVALDARGRPRFELLQRAGGRLQFVAFDLLWLDGEDLRDRPLEERRELLESVLANPPEELSVAERLPENLAKALAVAKRRGLEGVLAKRAGSHYVGGRTRDWLKHKVHATDEVAIVGWLPLKDNARRVGALLTAKRVDRGWAYTGKIGTGFSDTVRTQLFRLLSPDRVNEPPVEHPPRSKDAIWVTPKHVADVAFTEWTKDGMLRQPSFRGLREDKFPEECTR